jgi:hypothetical protein
MKLDDEIDRLFRLPLKEFTPARKTLAKQFRGADATRVRELQKPNAAAWAVNQLYWRERQTYERVVDAAEQLRKAHRSLLAGKAVDLHDAEAAHREAVRAASQKIRDILQSSDESDSAATMTAVGETLEALPSGDEQPGHLVRPLKRMGFEAIAGVGPRSTTMPVPKLSLVSSRERKTAPQKPGISPARQREIEEIETRLRTAQVDERQLQVEVERGRREVERAEREHVRAEQELAEAAAKLTRLRTELAAKEKARKAAEADQVKLEQRLEKLRPE